jgi:filamentous hemagglutinin family protein
MNAGCYKIVFSKRLGALVAVGEHTLGQGKAAGTGIRSGLAANQGLGFGGLGFVGLLKAGVASVAIALLSTGTATAAGLAPNALPTTALPTGAVVNAGKVAISTQGAAMTIQQTSDKASVNWNAFNIGSGASVNVQQNSVNSVLLNRVVGNDPSQILGKLTANGQVVLVNPNGIVFGKDGSVAASAFTASTFGISEQDFANGKYHYTRNSSTAAVTVENGASLSATAPGGYVALIGASVDNQGAISTQGGSVVMVAGEKAALPETLTSNVSVPLSGKVRLELLPSTINAMVSNSGTITTEGGQVLMQAAALSDAVASVTHTGVIDTTGVQGGAVTLQADQGNIQASGSVKANSTGAGNAGGDVVMGRDVATGVLAKTTDVSGAKLESVKGFVETSGDFLKTDQVSVKAREWLLDPTNITIAANGTTTNGTAYTSNYTAAADSVILASDINASLNNGTSVTLATSAAGSSTGNIAVNENISKKGGGDATLTLQAHGNITVAASKTITSNTGKLNVVFNSDSDGANGGAIVFNNGSGITSNGGNITLGGGTAGNGSGFATADGLSLSTIQGIYLNTSNISAGGGNIVMNGKSAATNYTGSLTNVSGIYMSGVSISTSGSGTINLTGNNQNIDTISRGLELASGTITGGSTGAVTITGDSRGVASSPFGNIKGASLNGTVTSTGGNISITGYGGAGTQYDYGVDIGGSVITVGSGTINITGTAGTGGSGGNVGVNTGGSGTISSVDGAIAISGTGAVGNNGVFRNHGVQIGGINAIRSTGAGNITVTGKATNSDNLFSRGVSINSGGLNANSGNIKIDGAVPQNYQAASYINAPITSTSGNIFIRSPGANITTSTTGVLSANNISIDNSNGSVDEASGVITPGGGGASFATGVGSQGVDINGSITASNNLNIYGNHTSSSTGVAISGASTTVSGKNITLYGKSSSGTGVSFAGGTLSGQYINAIGQTTTGYNGFAWSAGNINTTGTAGTSTASIVKGISAAYTTASNGFGALMLSNAGTAKAANAASGTTLTLAGEATTLTTGQNINERGILMQGSIPLSVSGDVTLDGSSKSSDGISMGGIITMTTVAGVTNKLTLKGTTAASSSNSLNGVNFSGSIISNASTSSINFIGEAKNLSGTTDKAVNLASAVTGGSSNVNIQALYGQLLVDVAVTGANISIDNTGGTIDATTGAITAGAGTSSYTTGVTINKALTATGNINVLGKVATTTNTGVNLTATGPITSLGAGKTININSNGNIANAAAITNTGSTGTGANINLASSSGTITGAGAIGDTINKNASVTFTQTGASTYDGAINAANFTKAGAGALTLDSWALATPFATNVSNAYTVKNGGSLTLSTGAYAQLNSANVNVENASTFSTSTSSSGWWKGTSFNFTGGNGGGVMNLGGNPVGITGTTNTFSTSGGATNTVNGLLNANGANVNFNLANASSGTTLADGSFAAISFAQSTQGGYGLGTLGGPAATVTKSGSGSLLFKDTVKASSLVINAGTVQVGDGSAATSTATANLDVPSVSIAFGSKLIFNRAEAYTSASTITGAGSLVQAGAGTLNLTGNSSAFAGATTVNAGKTLALGTGGSLGAAGSTVSLVDSVSQLQFTGASGVSTVGSTISGAGKVTQSGSGTTILLADNNYAGSTTLSDGTLQVGNAGTTGTLGAGNVTLSNNANLSYVRAANTTIANTISGAGNVSANITGADNNLIVDHAISLTGGTVTLVSDGNLSVTQAINTTNTSSSAIFLEAGKSTAAGTATGGDVTLSGSGALTAGSGARITIETGSVTGSKGLGVLAGNSRFNSDELTTNYNTTTAPLGSGLVAIYRESPTVTASFASASKTYDGQAYSSNNGLTYTGLVNGDTNAMVNTTTTGTSQGAKNAGTYTLTGIGTSDLGYTVAYTLGTLTINKANLSLAGTRVYDAGTTFSGQYLTAKGVAGETFTVLGNGDSSNLSSKNVQTAQNLNSLAGLTLGSSANGGLSENYNALSTTASSVSVTPKSATVNATDTKLTYNASTQNQLTVTTSGFIAGDAISITGQASGKNAGTYASSLTVSGNDASNYSFTVNNASLVIGKAALTATGNSSVVTYNGNNQSVNSFTLSGLQGSDQASSLSSINANGAFGKNTGSYTNMVTAGNEANYTVNTVNGTLQIDKANLSLSGTRVYDASTTFAGTYLTANGVAGETFTVSGNGDASNLSSKNVQTAQALSSITGLALGSSTNGGLSDNYNGLNAAASSVSVTPKSATVNATATKVTYNANIQNQLTDTTSGFIAGDAISITGQASGKNAGIYASNLAVSGNDASNYKLTITNANLEIAKADLILSGSRAYDATQTFAGQFLTATGVAGETFAVTGSGNTTNLNTKNLQKNQMLSSVTGLSLGNSNNGGISDNYNVLNTVKSEVSVTAKNASITSTQTDLTYNGTSQTQAAAVLAGFLDADVAAGTVSATGLATGRNTGNYSSNLSATGTDVGNYNITVTNNDLVIKPKELTFSAVTDSKIYDGTTNSKQAAIVTGSQTGDTITAVQAFTNKNVLGNGASILEVGLITIADGNNGKNYLIGKKATTTGTISKAALSVTAQAVTKGYDGTTSATGVGSVGSLAGKAAGEVVNSAGSQTFTDKNAGTGNKTVKASGVTIKDSSNADVTGNYEISYLDNTVSTITQKSITLDGITATNKTYDGTTAATVSTTGAVFKDQISGDVLTVSSTGTFSDKNVAAGKTVSLTNTLAGADLGNYNVTTQATTTADISKKSITLDGITAANKTYDGTTTATITAGAIATGIANETLAVSGTGTFSDKNAADDKTVTVADVTTLAKKNGTGDWRNYNLTTTGSITTTANIDKKNVTLDSITAANKVYDGTDTATITAGSITTGVGNETLAISGKGKFADTAPGTNKVVTVADVTTLTKTNGTGDWNNYKLNSTGSKTTKATITAVPPSPPAPTPSPASTSSGSAAPRVKIPLGSGNPFQLASVEMLVDEVCSASNLESCFCEASSISTDVSICYEKSGSK